MWSTWTLSGFPRLILVVSRVLQLTSATSSSAPKLIGRSGCDVYHVLFKWVLSVRHLCVIIDCGRCHRTAISSSDGIACAGVQHIGHT